MCNACLCGTLFFTNEVVVLALAVIAIVSNAWAVSLGGSMPGISSVGLFGIQCGSVEPGYVGADGEYIATNITADVANSFVDSFTNPEGQQTTCNDISPALAEVVGGGERFTIEDFYTAYLGGDFSVQWQVARACAIGFVALGFVKVVIAISKMCGCRFGGLAIWTTQLLQFAAGGVAFAAYMYMLFMAAENASVVPAAEPGAEVPEVAINGSGAEYVAGPASGDPLKYAGWALWTFLVSVGLTFVGLVVHMIVGCCMCCMGSAPAGVLDDEESQFMTGKPANGMS